ncbi:MAG TPA: site-2 protease family protein [Natronosporangium sp.]
MNPDDPLDRLAADEDWQRRAREIDRDMAKLIRREQRRQWRRGRLTSRFRSRRSGAGSYPGRGVSWLFLALLAITIGCGIALWTETGPAAPAVFGFVLAGWLVTLCLHEFSHALTAHRGGDDTIAGKGYLRLDPRRYGHPILTLVLPLLFLIAGGIPLPGGAVMVERHRLRNRFTDTLVSAAGPAVNVVAAVVLLAVVSIAGPAAIFDLGEPQAAFWAALTFLAYLQVATALLNLCPIPGLDGYGILEPYLPENVRRAGASIRPFGFLILLALLLLPPTRALFSTVVNGLVDLANPPINGVYFGYHLFQFWS